MTDRTVSYIGLGSNMGDKPGNLRAALELLSATPGIRPVRVASMYRTAPVGYTEQDWFVNTVAEVVAELSPHQLLEVLLDIEAQLGRVRTIRWGPRVVDLDLLLYGDRVISEPQLEVPHPRMTERAFVMVPLAELAPDLILPGGRRAEELAAELSSLQDIYKLL